MRVTEVVLLVLRLLLLLFSVEGDSVVGFMVLGGGCWGGHVGFGSLVYFIL